MTHQLYKLEIGDYFYFGSTKNEEDRYRCHKKDCYTINKPKYNNKLYTKIRELCPNPNNFYDFVDYQVYHKNLNLELKKYMENFYLQKHKDNPYCLNSNKRIYQQNENKSSYQRKYHQERVLCNICNKSMNRSSLLKHKKNIHLI